MLLLFVLVTLTMETVIVLFPVRVRLFVAYANKPCVLVGVLVIVLPLQVPPTLVCLSSASVDDSPE